jgi:hypothetical protein
MELHHRPAFDASLNLKQLFRGIAFRWGNAPHRVKANLLDPPREKPAFAFPGIAIAMRRM